MHPEFRFAELLVILFRFFVCEAAEHFLTETNDNGVMTRPIWELMNRLPMFERCENDGLKNTIWFADRVVNIPSSVRPSDLPKE